MTRYMYDAVTLANIPAEATMIAPYVDGRYANIDEARRRFPHAELVPITVFGGHTVADVVDCEKGDATPPQAAAWAKWRHDAGAHPTIYCNTSTRPAVIAECHKLGLALGRDFEIWEAHYDGVSTIPTGDAAKQYLGDYHGYDKSSVVAYWRGVDPVAPPHPVAHVNPYPRPDYVRHPIDCRHDDLRVRLAVKWLQWALGVTVDGKVGPHTRAAVGVFQSRHGLARDFIVGHLTGDQLARVHR